MVGGAGGGGGINLISRLSLEESLNMIETECAHKLFQNWVEIFM